MERDESWWVKRDKLIGALTDHLSRHEHSADRRVKFAQGVLCYLKGDKQTQDEFYEALSNGAQLVHIPLAIGETGMLTLQCCWEISSVNYTYPLPDVIELTIFSHQVWTCPRCGKVYALFNEAADGSGEAGGKG